MSFIWNGVSSDTMKFNVTSRQVYNAPAYDLNAIEVPGRSGDLLNPQNRFKNKQITYTGFLKASDFEGSTWREKLSTGLIQLKGWLCSDAGQYHELTDDYDPGFTRYGYISGETAISDIEDRPFGVTLTVTFNCKPFMYKAGEPMELPETKSASGSIITITDGAENTPLKSAVVNIEPVQDLHGYDFPWPAGGGKNLLLVKYPGRVNNGVTYATNSDGTVSLSGTASGSSYFASNYGFNTDYMIRLDPGAYTISGSPNNNIRVYGTLWSTSGTSLRNIPPDTGAGSSFNVTEESWFSFQIFVSTGTNTGVTIYPQIERGDIKTAYSPYSNICPISGWTQAKVARTGGNLMPGFDSGLWGTADTTGWTISNFSPTPASFPFDMSAGKYTGVPAIKVYLRGGVEYSISASPGKYWCISYYDEGDNKISNGASGWGIGTFTPPVGTAYAIFGISNYQGTATTLTVSTQVQIAIGSSLPAWTAYEDTATPITIPLGQTVYGGTLDVVRGKLNAKPYYASYSGQTLVGPWISSHDKYVAGATPTTGAQVVDMGAAGTDYDVTPQTIKTLLGTNNIWADAGEMSIEYPIPTENPYPFGSRPLYEITMAGTGTLVVNGREWTITDYTGTLYCDTEAMEWYDASQLRNNIVSGDGWPVFEAGENSVSYTGDITKVMVTPRWRTL